MLTELQVKLPHIGHTGSQRPNEPLKLNNGTMPSQARVPQAAHTGLSVVCKSNWLGDLIILNTVSRYLLIRDYCILIIGCRHTSLSNHWFPSAANTSNT